MKKVLIGGFLSINGSIWALAMAPVVESNLASSWSTPPGRLLTTVQEMGLMALFPAAIFLVAVFFGDLRHFHSAGGAVEKREIKPPAAYCAWLWFSLTFSCNLL